MMQMILEAPEWIYWGRNACYPEYNMIRLSDGKTEADAWRVFEALCLNLRDLYKVYPDHPRTPPARYGLRGSRYFHALKGRSCHWQDFQSWMMLTRLTGKTIRLFKGIGPFAYCEAMIIATFYPDGRIEEHPEFLSELKEDSCLESYWTWKRELPGVMMTAA